MGVHTYLNLSLLYAIWSQAAKKWLTNMEISFVLSLHHFRSYGMECVRSDGHLLCKQPKIEMGRRFKTNQQFRFPFLVKYDGPFPDPSLKKNEFEK